VNNPPHLHVRNVSFSSSTKATVNVNGFWYVSTQWQVVTRLNLVQLFPLKPEDVPPSLNLYQALLTVPHLARCPVTACRDDTPRINEQMMGT